MLHNDNYKLDWFFKFSLIKDLAGVGTVFVFLFRKSCIGASGKVERCLPYFFQGMEYMHSMLGSHGRLRSSNCLVDQAWTLKVTDYGLYKMRVPKKEAKG